MQVCSIGCGKAIHFLPFSKLLLVVMTFGRRFQSALSPNRRADGLCLPLVKKCGIPPITEQNENRHCHRRRRLSRLERRHPRRRQGGRQARLGNPRHHRRLRRPAGAAPIIACWITRRSTACWCAAAPFSARPIAENFPPRPATAKAASCRRNCSTRPKPAWTTLGLSALVSIGGDGSLTIAQQMHEHGIPDRRRAQDD